MSDQHDSRELDELLAAVAQLERELAALPPADLMTPGGPGDRAAARWILAGPDQAMRRMRFLAWPRLLVPGVIEALRAVEAAKTPDAATAGSGPTMTALLDYAVAQRTAAERDPLSVPVAAGPIELLWSALGTRKASEAQVYARAATPVVVSTLSVPYIRALAEFAWRMAEQGTPGLTMARLLLSATGAETAQQPGIGGTLRWWAAVAFMDVVRRLLKAGPDGPLFAEAIGYGEQALPLARQDGAEATAAVLLSLGQLVLGPYTSDRELAGYPDEIRQWLELEGEHGPGEPQMPPAADALSRAVRWLRDCVRVARDRQRGLARRALALALLYQGELDAKVDRDEVASQLYAALEDLDPQHDTQNIAMTRAMLRNIDPSRGNSNDATAPDTDSA